MHLSYSLYSVGQSSVLRWQPSMVVYLQDWTVLNGCKKTITPLHCICLHSRTDIALSPGCYKKTRFQSSLQTSWASFPSWSFCKSCKIPVSMPTYPRSEANMWTLLFLLQISERQSFAESSRWISHPTRSSSSSSVSLRFFPKQT